MAHLWIQDAGSWDAVRLGGAEFDLAGLAAQQEPEAEPASAAAGAARLFRIASGEQPGCPRGRRGRLRLRLLCAARPARSNSAPPSLTASHEPVLNPEMSHLEFSASMDCRGGYE